MKFELRANATASISLRSPDLFTQSSLTGALRGCLGSLNGACIEKLFLHCASALESNDITLAQQVMWVLNNVASSTGDPNQRLTSWLLRALVVRASRICPAPMSFNGGSTVPRRLMTVTQLAGYVDLIPWHRFGFSVSNNVIYKAVQGCSKVHILDFSITHCMQWPTLIDALARRPEGSPSLRITVPSIRPPVPPLVNVSTEEVGLRLSNFAKFRDVPFDFRVISDLSSPTSVYSSTSSGFDYEALLSLVSSSNLDLDEEETLVVNCQNWLRYLPDEQNGARDAFIDIIKSLNPRIIVVVDEDSDLSSSSLTSRITTCFNYLWIPFDALETFLPKESTQRVEYESDIGHKIANIISFEGGQRIERLESGVKLSQRMRSAGFLSLTFCDETVREVKELLEEHSSGWSMKREEGTLILTWKGHNSVFAMAWVPNGVD